MSNLGDEGASTVTKLGTDAGMKTAEVAVDLVKAITNQLIHLNSVEHKLAKEQLREWLEKNSSQSQAMSMPAMDQLKEIIEKNSAQLRGIPEVEQLKQRLENTQALNIPKRDLPKVIPMAQPGNDTGVNLKAQVEQGKEIENIQKELRELRKEISALSPATAMQNPAIRADMGKTLKNAGQSQAQTGMKKNIKNATSSDKTMSMSGWKGKIADARAVLEKSLKNLGHTKDIIKGKFKAIGGRNDR